MADTMEIIISAVDSASEVFQSIIESAQGMGDTIQESLDGASFDEMSSALDNANAEVERLTDELAGIYMGDIEGDAEAVEAALAAAQEEAQRLSDALAEAGDNSQGMEDAVNGIESLMAFQAIGEYVTSLADAMWEVTDRAGNVQDSWDRLGLAAEGAGINVDDMKESVSSLSSETGRAGGTIREAFINMTSAGISDMGTMQTVFKGASAQAFILGTDVDALANKFAGMSMKSSIAERTLKGTGITVDELGDALGLHGATIDEINDKWETLSTDQRAAALGMAASMNEGEDANEAYKNSWQGLQDQIDIAKGKLEVLAGKVFLPVLIPAMEAASRVLDFLSETLSGLMNGPLGTIISVVGSAAGALVLLLAGVAAVSAGMGFFTASLFPAIAASWALIAPWLPFIAIGAAAVALIYEIGKAFGWWTDASSMMDAVWSGLQRLWDAFINHPDVQAVIQGITDAWNWLYPVIMDVVGAVMDFLGLNESGSFDVVGDMIRNIGIAWQVISTPIRIIISLVQQVISAFNAFRTGQIDLPAFIITVLTAIANSYRTVFNTVIGLVVRFGSQLLARGVAAASRFVNGIINRIRALPGRAYSALLQVVGRITSAIQAWINAGVAKVNELVSKVTSPFSGIAGKISSGLSGVADAILSPFKTAWEWIKPYYDKIKGALDLLGQIPGGAQGGESAPLEYQTDIISGNDFNIETGDYIISDESTIEVDHNLYITLDLEHVPAHMSQEALIAGITDPKVVKAFVDNKVFQDADSKVKQRINLKTKRARGA